MSVCYYLGAKSGVAKKSGRWFGFAIMLAHDQYGAPSTTSAWFSDKDSFESSVRDLIPGTPCIVHLDMDGKVAVLSPDDRYDVLEFPPEFFGGGS